LSDKNCLTNKMTNTTPPIVPRRLKSNGDDNDNDDIWRESTAKLMTLYGRGTSDFHIVQMPDGLGAYAIVLGRPFPVMAIQSDTVQFYTEDCLLRIDFPLVELKGCHTFMLTRFIGKGEFDSAYENWEFEEFVRVKE